MKNFALSILAIFLLFGFSSTIFADEYQDKQNQISNLEKKVAELQDKSHTLADQIEFYDTQIVLTTLKISQTEGQITSISGKIDQLEIALRTRSALLQSQIVQTYKKGPIDPLQLFLTGADVSTLLARLKYLQLVQANNRKILHDIQVVQTNYTQQKELIQQSQKKLQTQKQTLASIRTERDNLLKETKNSEGIYQKQLEQARLELQTIQTALVSGIKEGPVKAGDPIGIVGNSGYPYCSTAAHLHFEVHKGNNWVNAETYLKAITDRWGLNIGSGTLNWPLQGNIEVTQRYGITPYSYRYAYSDGMHTGIDMVSSDKIIRAVADGMLYSSSQKCGSATINVKYIDHGEGVKTFYLHVQ